MTFARETTAPFHLAPSRCANNQKRGGEKGPRSLGVHEEAPDGGDHFGVAYLNEEDSTKITEEAVKKIRPELIQISAVSRITAALPGIYYAEEEERQGAVPGGASPESLSSAGRSLKSKCWPGYIGTYSGRRVCSLKGT